MSDKPSSGEINLVYEQNVSAYLMEENKDLIHDLLKPFAQFGLPEEVFARLDMEYVMILDAEMDLVCFCPKDKADLIVRMLNRAD